MPSKYRNRRRRRRGKRNVVRLSSRQARTGAYDSKIEKVMARVARKEDLKAKQKLVFRQYLFGPYNIATNIWASSTGVSFFGVITPIAAIQKVDNSTATAIVPVGNPYQTPTTHVPTGANVIANVLSYDGFRRGNWISVHGIQLDVYAHTLALGVLVPVPIEHVNLYIQICAMQWDGSDTTAAIPLAMQCGNMVPLFGYNRKTDQQIYDLAKPFKRRVLYKTKLRFKVNRYLPDVKRFTKYIKLSPPLKILYKDFDQNGQQIERWKPFLVLRSDCPDDPAYTNWRPKVNVCTTLHYTDT